jgi:hypothetical protein
MLECMSSGISPNLSILRKPEVRGIILPQDQRDIPHDVNIW